MINFTATTAGSVGNNPAAIVKLGQTMTAVPKFEYRAGNFLLEGKFAGSNSISWYDPRGRRGSIRDAGGPTAAGVGFTAAVPTSTTAPVSPIPRSPSTTVATP